MRSYPQFEDLGLDPAADLTEDMRKAPAATEALRKNDHPKHQIGRTVMTTVTECRNCTVPVTNGDLCTFCTTYTPPETPAQQLDVAVNRIDILRHDLNAILDSLPPDAPLFAVADLTTGICHLKRAAVAIDRSADQLEAAEVK